MYSDLPSPAISGNEPVDLSTFDIAPVKTPVNLNAAKRDVSAPSLSALAKARNIERLQDIEYPEGIKSPREDLNKDVKDGKFRYLSIVYAIPLRFSHVPAGTTGIS